MFVSQLYTGLNSDKETVERSGLLHLLKSKINNGEILPGVSIMAVNGFDISEKLALELYKYSLPGVLTNEIRCCILKPNAVRTLL